jgi:DNA replication protein DnaC
MPEELCPICEGAGLRVIERADGTRAAVPCDCRAARRSTRMIQQARIPQRYADCNIANYITNQSNSSLAQAKRDARRFIEMYPLETDGKGLLFTGNIGVGKTHLAVGVLQSLIADRGAHGIFFDYRDLLKNLQNSYERKVDQTEQDILGPVLKADVLLLDEFGGSKPSDWASDTIAHIINTRYNERRSTIITTNYPNLPAAATVERDAWAAMRQDTLGDRIGERMRSRLQEMCIVIEMKGDDYRQTTNRAKLSAV